MTGLPPMVASHEEGGVPARFRLLEVLATLGATSGSSLHWGHLGDGTPVLVKRSGETADPRIASDHMRRELQLLNTLAQADVGLRPLALLAYPVAPALVLEDRPGGLLDRILAARRLDTIECLEIGIDLAAALAELHAAGIVDRDLRPANVLVGRSEGSARMGAWFVDLSRAVPEGAPQRIDAGDDLAYLAPEWSGRVGRGVDARSDLYSLGVLLYQMLTGTLPFTATDVRTWIECHVARQPRPPAQIGPVPRLASDVVMKLLAKLPDDRYRTADGARQDLEECLRQYRAGGDRLASVEARDVSPRFRLPGRLSGRIGELDRLLRAHQHSAESGATTLVMVEGPPGIGKTALVNELRRQLTDKPVHFGSGAFGRDGRGPPYRTLGRAVSSVVEEILSAGEEEADRWRAHLLDALGSQGRLLTEVLEPLGRLIGPQPPVPDLQPSEHLKRVERIWQRFLAALARPDRPLVLFLDDLQWADPETLSLIAYLAGDPATHHLLILGAAHGGDLAASHPLRTTQEALRAHGIALETIALGPLSVDCAMSIVAEALCCDRARAEELARHLHARTAGDPYSLFLLLSALVEDGRISFDPASGAWVWDLDRIGAHRAGENAAALLSEELRRLPEAAQRALRLAGSFGDGALLDLVARVDGRERGDVERDLAGAVGRGLIRVNGDGTLTFAHDLVAQAARDLTPPGERPAVHRRIAGELLASRSGRDLADDLFDAVWHLERAGPVLTPDERIRLSELELEAGRRAHALAAYPTAARHSAAGQQLLPADAWSSHHELSHGLALARARAEWMRGDDAAAEEWTTVLFREARSRAELAEAYRLRVDMLTARGDMGGGAQAALEACAKLYGLEVPLHPSPAIRDAALVASLEAIARRTTEQQLDAPGMVDPDERALLALIVSSAPALHSVDPSLHDLLACEVVLRSVAHGNSPDSAHGFAWVAVAAGSRLGRWTEAARLSALACAVSDRNASRHKAGCLLAAGILQQQVRPPTDVVRVLRDAWFEAVDGGEVNQGCHAGIALLRMLLAGGAPLEDVAEEARRQLQYARTARYPAAHDTILAIARFVEMLRGGTLRLGSFDGPGFDTAEFEARMPQQHPILLETYHGFRAFAELLDGNFAAAVEACARARPFVQEGTLITNPHFWFVAGLAASGRHDEVSGPEQATLLAEARAARERVRAMVDRNPRAFSAGLALISAEVARLEGQDRQAIDGYEEAMAIARAEGHVHVEAIAGEAAGRFCRERRWSVASAAYTRAAYDAYRRWGATAKAEALSTEDPRIRPERAGPAAAEGDRAQPLDLLSAAARLSLAISGEMNLERLLEKLLRTVVQAAGAHLGVLLLDGGPELVLTARVTLERPELEVEVSSGAIAAEELPAQLLASTRRTHEPVVLSDAAAPNPYLADPALRRRGARSVACLPIQRRGAVQGLLYLENDELPNAFTPERLPLLELLASQAAISLELSRHREQIEQLVARRTTELTRANDSLKAANRKLELAHRQLLRSEKMASIGRLAAGVAHEINNPVAYAASNLKALEGCLVELLQEMGLVAGAQPPTAGLRAAARTARLQELRTELTSMVGDARHGLDRVTTIVRALRTLSHVSESTWQVTDIRLGIESTLHLLRQDLDAKAVVVVEHGETPPVECLAPELNQVFVNLLLNAAHAITDRGTIAVRSGAAGDEVWIEVSDTGVGIPPEDLSRIFDPFFTTKSVGEGTGLGLSLAYGIVEKHHGRIEVSSEVGKGTTFRIWLPVRQPTHGSE